VPIPFTDPCQIWQQTVHYTYGLCLHTKFHLNPFTVSPSRDKKRTLPKLELLSFSSVSSPACLTIKTASTTETIWPSYSLLHYLLPFPSIITLVLFIFTLMRPSMRNKVTESVRAWNHTTDHWSLGRILF